MSGDNSIRFCGTCERHVYNLSEMTSEQIETLLAAPSGRTCVRFFQRADGTVMTADCPVAARRVRRQRIAVGVGAGLMSALGYAGMTLDTATTPLPSTVVVPAPAPVPAPVPAPRPIEMVGQALPPPPSESIMGRIAPHPEELVERQGDVAEVR